MQIFGQYNFAVRLRTEHKKMDFFLWLHPEKNVLVESSLRPYTPHCFCGAGTAELRPESPMEELHLFLSTKILNKLNAHYIFLLVQESMKVIKIILPSSKSFWIDRAITGTLGQSRRDSLMQHSRYFSFVKSCIVTGRFESFPKTCSNSCWTFDCTSGWFPIRNKVNPIPADTVSWPWNLTQGVLAMYQVSRISCNWQCKHVCQYFKHKCIRFFTNIFITLQVSGTLSIQKYIQKCISFPAWKKSSTLPHNLVFWRE